MTKLGIRTLCGAIGCKELRPCPAHAKKAWVGQQAKPKRVTGRRLQRMREALIQRDPLCRVCKAEGKVTLGTIRDHITPLAEGGRDDESNEQMICAMHHNIKTRSESMRGRGLNV